MATIFGVSIETDELIDIDGLVFLNLHGFQRNTDEFGGQEAYDDGYQDGVTDTVEPDPEKLADIKPITRWVPYVVTVEAVDPLLVSYETGQLRFLIFDGTRAEDDRWSAFFGQRSFVTDLGSNQYQLTILPNGGWNYRDFSIRVGSGVVFASESFTLIKE